MLTVDYTLWHMFLSIYIVPGYKGAYIGGGGGGGTFGASWRAADFGEQLTGCVVSEGYSLTGFYGRAFLFFFFFFFWKDRATCRI